MIYSSHTYKNFAKLVLVFYLIITLLALFPIANIKFDYDFEKFFPKQDKEYDYYQKFLKKFGRDNNVLLISIKNKEGIFNEKFLKKVDCFSDSIKKIEHIESVLSPVKMKYALINLYGFIEIPYFHVYQPEMYYQDSLKVFSEKLLIRNLIAENGKSMCLVINTDSGISKTVEDKIIENIYRQLNYQNFDNYYMAGRVISQTLLVEKMQWELLIFMSASAVLVMVFLILAFRSVWGVIVPVTVVMLSVIYLVSLMAIIGKSLDILTILLPTILFVVGMSDVVHIWSKYLQELRWNKTKEMAIFTTLKEVGSATLLTSITTAIGFLSLLSSSITPIQDLGFYTAIGVFIAFFIAFTLLPAALYLMPLPILSKTQKYNYAWNTLLSNLFILVFRNQKKILAIFLAITILAIYGIFNIKINAKILDDISDTEKIKTDLKFLETNYTGIRPFEMVIKLEDTSKTIFDYDFLMEIDKIESYLYSEYGLNYIVSPLSIIKTLNKSMNGGLQTYYKLPNRDEMRKIIPKLKLLKGRTEFKKLASEKTNEIRISGRMNDEGSFLINEKNKLLESFVEKSVERKLVSVKLTGSALLIDKNNEHLSSNLVQGLAIGFVFIGFIVYFLFRDIKMVVVFFIPNIIPLIIVGGIMGYAGIDLKASTSIIFTIAFGIAVDDTIHFLSKLKMELDKGKSTLYAIKSTFLNTGKAIIITSIILSGGFLTLLFSDFGGTFYTGLLVGLTLILALIADLLLLPVLLVISAKYIR